MTYSRSLVLGLAFLGLTASSGYAQSWLTQGGSGTPGPYMRLEGGWSHPEDLTGNAVTGIPGGIARQNEGYIFGIAGGYKWGPWRGELDLDYSHNGLRSGTNVFTGATRSSGLGGSSSNLAFMLNGYYDFATGTRFTPYLGFGVGGDYFSLHQVKTTTLASNISIANSNDVVFAYQPIVGVSYAINDQWSAGLEYRYFSTTDAKIKYQPNPPAGKFTIDPTSHNILATITFHFGAPPAPPPPMPAAAPAPPPPAAPSRQNFIVFFEFDKSSLTADGQKVVAAAAAAYKQGGRAKISLAGYTDRAGTETYNLKLSQRRAESVRAVLVKEGVPDNQIAASWFGEQNQRVPTADGVREPQNRRVEIEF